MTPEDFRRAGHQLIDWIADYRTHIEEYPVFPQVQPGEIAQALEDSDLAAAVHHPANFTDLLEEFEQTIMPGLTHWQSPNFFAYFPTNATFGSILGELWAAGLAVNAFSWATSPAATEMETVMVELVRTLLDLPDQFRNNGVIQDTASSGTLCAILAARHATNLPITQLVGYTSAEAHSSVEKGLRVAGFQHIRLIPTTADFALDTQALRDAIATDLQSGLTPCVVAATVGTTSTGAVDPVESIAEVAEQHSMWLHVDAAMHGVAALAPEYRWVNTGLERAHSYVTNPHKWMGVQFDCSCLWVRDRDALTSALSIEPAYLRSALKDAGTVLDYRDWQVQLGRRFRALKLWTTLRLEGIDAITARIRAHVAMTQELGERIEESPFLELVAPHPLNLVCFAHRESDAGTEEIVNRINASGAAHLTLTKAGGRSVARVCIGSWETDQTHVDALWNRVESATDRAEHTLHDGGNGPALA